MVQPGEDCLTTPTRQGAAPLPASPGQKPGLARAARDRPLCRLVGNCSSRGQISTVHNSRQQLWLSIWLTLVYGEVNILVDRKLLDYSYLSGVAVSGLVWTKAWELQL